ncbi:MAG: hypothetical protein ACYC67_10055 [Prosthecobacter sp.]
MKIVGDHLAAQAAVRSDPTEFDLFCRSAFNRYYYASFLAVRNVLKTLDSSWATPTHKDIPEMLTGAVLKRMRAQIQKATRNELISRGEGSQMNQTATTAASDLANLLTAARETRRLADYEPETKVQRIDSQIKLGQATLELASKWENRVSAQSKTILKIYAQLGLI